MDSGRCKVISFILSSLYRVTAFAGLLTIFMTGDAKLSGIIIASALVLFAASYYIEAMVCQVALSKHRKADKSQTVEYKGLVRHIESTRQR